MRILGISAFRDLSACALVEDGRVVAAAAEERFTRRPRDSRAPASAAAYCLREAGIGADRLDVVAFHGKPVTRVMRAIEASLDRAPFGFGRFAREAPVWLRQTLRVPSVLARALGGYRGPMLYAEALESHAANAFYSSPFERAAILVTDEGGEGATTSLGRGEGRTIQLLREMRAPDSLSTLLGTFSGACGFAPGVADARLAEIAALGSPAFADEIRRIVDLRDDGSFRLDRDCFGVAAGQASTPRFESRFGPARAPGTPLTKREFDLAASVQAVVGEALSRTARHLRTLTGEENLVVAGEAAAHAAASGRLSRDGAFRRVWIPPSPDDAGAALGAAWLAWHGYLGKERRPAAEGFDAGAALLGPAFPPQEIEAVLNRAGATFERLAEDRVPGSAAELLANGRIVGWFQGRMEFGPHPRGARSILADPRSAATRERVNREVKYREAFRPCAAAVSFESAGRYFDAPPESLTGQQAFPARAAAAATGRAGADGVAIPAVTHGDGTALPLAVRREANPAFHALLAAFEARTGCGVLLQTSLNLPGEPLACSPLEAYRCFMRAEIDALLLGPFLLEKSKQRALLEDPDWPRRFAEVS